jgi:hypothetical protein
MSIKLRDHINSYEFTCELPSDGRSITFKPFTTGQMKKMLVYENSTDPFMIESILDDIMNECVITEDFFVDELLLQDRFYLLLKIRENSKGDIYNFNYTCSKCNMTSPKSIKISEMKVTPMDVDETPIVINDKISVKMKLITRGEQKEVYKRVNRKKLTTTEKFVEVVTMSVAQSMNTFIVGDEEDSNIPLEDKIDLIDNGIPTSGFETLKKWLEDNDFGMQFTTDLNCIGCGNEEKYSIPVDNFFA